MTQADTKQVEADPKSLDLSQMRPPGFLKDAKRFEDELIAKITRGSGWKENPGCLVCGSPRREPQWPAHGVMLLRCEECGLRYFEKRPRDLAEVYEGQVYLDKSKTSYLSNVDYRMVRFARERLGILAEYKPFVPGQRLLDVGCGTGWFLRAAKERGYAPHGFEFSAALAGFTADTIGCPVYAGELSSVRGAFDVVTMFDVIEHVPEPTATFATVRELLAPGGVALVFCPNFESLAIGAQTSESNLVMPTRHLSYFNRSSVEELCRRGGVQLMWFRTCGIDIGDLMAWQESKGMPRDLQLWQRLSDTLQPAIDSLGAGNHLRFMARRAS